MYRRAAAPDRAAWQSYWSHEREQPAYATQGRLTAALDAHWNHVFLSVVWHSETPTCLDVAAGNGDLSARMLKQLERQDRHSAGLVACDLSDDAVKQIVTQKHARAVCCDAARLPFGNQHFDLVASQFGLEYAGTAALAECARVTAPGGTIALVMHHRDGALHKENSAILKAVEEFQASRLLETFADLARNGQDEAAHRTFVSAVKAAESALHLHGPDIAAGSLLRLYREVATLHGNLSRYDPQEVMHWCGQMGASLASYAARTRWMMEVALTAEAIEDAKSLLEASGLVICQAEPVLDHTAPIAWSLIATRKPMR